MHMKFKSFVEEKLQFNEVENKTEKFIKLLVAFQL